jgi:hypothetical protein
LIWIGTRLRHPTAITLATDLSVAYYTLSTGKGYTRTFRNSSLLQIQWFLIKLGRGHGLVLRWVPSQAKLADPVSRGVLARHTARRL